MNDELLAIIKKLVNGGRYRIKIHAVRHMIEEGFSERDIIVAILGKSRIIEIYDEDKRCLILGRFLFPKDLGGRHLRKEGGDHEKNRYV